MVREDDDKAALAYVLTCAQFGLWVPGNEDKRLAIAQELIELGEELGDVELLSSGWGWLYTNYWEQGDANAARDAADRMAEFADRLRMPDSQWMAGTMRACLRAVRGSA